MQSEARCRIITVPFLLFNLFLGVVLVIDLGFFRRNNRAICPREALIWTGLWVSMALLFGGGVSYFGSPDLGFQFFTGYIVEKSLSIDNLFLFLMIFRHYKVSKHQQSYILLYGIIGALLMRMIMILGGVQLVSRYQWLLYIFGVFLVFTGLKMLFLKDTPTSTVSENFLTRWIRRHLPIKKEEGEDCPLGNRFFVKENGKWVATPLFLILILVESTDVIFALDSIPAIFAITQDPFIIYTSNAFAIMGLRSLYFALADMMDRFHYLKTGISLILLWIGGKMLVEHWVLISPGVSLGITLLILLLSILFSLLRSRA